MQEKVAGQEIKQLFTMFHVSVTIILIKNYLYRLMAHCSKKNVCWSAKYNTTYDIDQPNTTGKIQ